MADATSTSATNTVSSGRRDGAAGGVLSRLVTMGQARFAVERPGPAALCRELACRWQLEPAQELDLPLEHDAELVEHATARLGHQLDRVACRGAACVFDEVRMPRRDDGAADAISLQTAQFDHPTGTELVLRVFEHAAEGPLVRRLR